MGNSIIHNVIFRVTIFTVLTALIIFSIIFAFPFARRFLSSYSIAYYHYAPQSKDILDIPAATGAPAQAVPFLMYHGVIHENDAYNTTVDQFIAHMEFLKKEGYTTISVAEFEKFRLGEFTLPAKPIVITFDDGRKDSFYTTDDIFKKLGFKATLFEATGPLLKGNSFYLTWKELKKMQDTGRWEIEAHGRNSHDKISISANSTDEQGRFLTSKLYLPQERRIETTEEFEKRVEQDYINGINDLRNNLGLDPKYYAIPLNDYGERPTSNYAGATAFNREIIKKYFKLAFIQANDSDDVTHIYLPVYNFADEDPYLVRRIEMKNMPVEVFAAALGDQKPIPPSLQLSSERIVADGPDSNGQVIYGKTYWQNYSVTARMKRSEGRSISLLFYFKDEKNYLSFGTTDNGYFLRNTVNGFTKDVAAPYIPETPNKDIASFKVVVEGDSVICYLDSKVIYNTTIVGLDSGAVGIRVWDDQVAAVGTLESLVVKPLK